MTKDNDNVIYLHPSYKPVVKESQEYVTDFIDKLHQFNGAALNLLFAWEQLDVEDHEKTDGGLYPFEHSFDEMVPLIIDWVVDLKEKLGYEERGLDEFI